MAKKKINLTYEDVIKLNACISGMENRSRGLSADTWVKVSKIKYDIEDHHKAIIEGRNKITDKYVVKENGQYKVDEGGTEMVYKKEDGREKFEEELKDFVKGTIEVQFEQVKATALAKASFDGIPGITTFFKHCVN